MDGSALKIVLRVHAHGSIAGAARALDLDPSSVSRVVGTVEAGLGIRLFHRTTRKLTVTDEGRVYLNRVAPVLEELDAAKEEANGLRTLPAGLLRMTASMAFSYQIIVPLLPEFQEKYPNITIDLQASDASLDLLENGIDLAIRLAPTPHPNLISTHLMPTKFKAVASPSYLKANESIVTPHDLTRMNCLQLALPGLRNLWRFHKPGEANFEVPLRANLCSSSPLVLRQAAVSGMGVALMADWMIGKELLDGRLIELFPDYDCAASTEVWALCPDMTYIPRKVRAMIDFLKSHVRQQQRN